MVVFMVSLIGLYRLVRFSFLKLLAVRVVSDCVLSVLCSGACPRGFEVFLRFSLVCVDVFTIAHDFVSV